MTGGEENLGKKKKLHFQCKDGGRPVGLPSLGVAERGQGPDKSQSSSEGGTFKARTEQIKGELPPVRRLISGAYGLTFSI